MHITNEKLVRLLLPVVIGAGFTYSLLSAMTAATDIKNGVGPHVGDIVSFNASAIETPDDAVKLTVSRPGQPDCVLELGTLRHTGGSLIIESQAEIGADFYRVHWAGDHTSEGAGNCGANADLVLGTRELDILTLSANGNSWNRKRFSMAEAEAGF